MTTTSKLLVGGSLVLLVGTWIPLAGHVMLSFGSPGLAIFVLQRAASRYGSAAKNNKQFACSINIRLIFLAIGVLVLLFWSLRLTTDDDTFAIAIGMFYMYTYFPSLIVLIGSVFLYSFRSGKLGWDLRYMLIATVVYTVSFIHLFVILYDKWIIFSIAVFYASSCILLSAIWLNQQETA